MTHYYPIVPPTVPDVKAEIVATKGLPKEGLYLRVNSSGNLEWGWDMLVMTDGEDDLLEVGAKAWTSSISGLTPDARYYVYVGTEDGSGTPNLYLSASSERLGGTFTPGGSDVFWREIGEFTTDALGDIVKFSRNGDRVEFLDFRSCPIYVSHAQSSSFTEHLFPFAMPLRSTQIELLARSSDIGRMMPIIANDSSGAGLTTFSSYTNNSSSSWESALQSLTADHQLKDPDQNSIWERNHFPTGSASASMFLYCTGYEWGI